MPAKLHLNHCLHCLLHRSDFEALQVTPRGMRSWVHSDSWQLPHMSQNSGKQSWIVKRHQLSSTPLIQPRCLASFQEWDSQGETALHQAVKQATPFLLPKMKTWRLGQTWYLSSNWHLKFEVLLSKSAQFWLESPGWRCFVLLNPGEGVWLQVWTMWKVLGFLKTSLARVSASGNLTQHQTDYLGSIHTRNWSVCNGVMCWPSCVRRWDFFWCEISLKEFTRTLVCSEVWGISMVNSSQFGSSMGRDASRRFFKYLLKQIGCDPLAGYVL